MSSPLSDTLPIGEWVEKWNHLVFFQPDDELSAKVFAETVDPDVIVKINHDVHDINGLSGGIKWVRTSFKTTLDSNEELVHWSAPNDEGGAAVHKTTFTSRDLASGTTTTKTSFVTTIVKKVDGKRKISELVEVEIEIEKKQ